MPQAPTDPWARLRALFEAASALHGGEREAIIAQAGLGAEALAELRSLLRHHDQATGGQPFLQAPAMPEAAGAARAGQRLGAWAIVRPIGSGGMGEVFEARRADGSFEGRAAVKLLKRGMDSSAVLARFALERQALARLAHPHIARLLDAGASEEGLPYFVMEYVDGRPIHEAALGQPLERRLALFLQLAGAVSFAHRNLLVHRDLKPGNVLVDAEGQVKLLDFGIAKALDPLEGHDGQTTVGGPRPFTPHYASPEQVRGEPVSTATDIYSLGVLLYQMLTGARPTGRGATTPQEAARRVLEEAPARPSRLSPQEAQDPQWLATRRRLEGDLDNILLMALRKEPGQRYASVDALAADVQAFLDGRPVSARRASAGYVLAKFVQRHRWPVLAAAAGTVGLATALVATVLQGRVAAAAGVLLLAAGLVLALLQARRAQLARAEALQARDEARRQLERVKRITHDLVFRYGDTVTQLPGGDTAQEALLHDTVTLLEPALAGAPDDADLAATMVSALGRLAEIQGNSTTAAPARRPAAQATVAQGLALAERAWPQRRGDWRFANWTARLLMVRAQLHRAAHELEPALEALGRMSERAAEALHRSSDPEGRVYLACAQANAHLARAQINAHASMPSLGRPEAALNEYRQAEAAYRALLAQPEQLAACDRNAAPGDVSTENYVWHQLAALLTGRALVHLLQGDAAAMLEQAEAALAIQRGVVEREPQVVPWRDGLMTAANTAARALLLQGRAEAALPLTQLAQDTRAWLVHGQGPDSKWAQPRIGAMLAGPHGQALLAAGRAAEAVAVLQAGAAYWRGEPPSPEAQAIEGLLTEATTRAAAP